MHGTTNIKIQQLFIMKININKMISVTAKHILVLKTFLDVLVPLYVTNQNKV